MSQNINNMAVAVGTSLRQKNQTLSCGVSNQMKELIAIFTMLIFILKYL